MSIRVVSLCNELIVSILLHIDESYTNTLTIVGCNMLPIRIDCNSASNANDGSNDFVVSIDDNSSSFVDVNVCINVAINCSESSVLITFVISENINIVHG